MHLISDWPRVGRDITDLHVCCLLVVFRMSKFGIKSCRNTVCLSKMQFRGVQSLSVYIHHHFVLISTWHSAVFTSITGFMLTLIAIPLPPPKHPTSTYAYTPCALLFPVAKKPHYRKYSICLRILFFIISMCRWASWLYHNVSIIFLSLYIQLVTGMEGKVLSSLREIICEELQMWAIGAALFSPAYYIKYQVVRGGLAVIKRTFIVTLHHEGCSYKIILWHILYKYWIVIWQKRTHASRYKITQFVCIYSLCVLSNACVSHSGSLVLLF